MGCVDGENCALSLAGHLETTGLSKEMVVRGPWTWGRAVQTDGLGGPASASPGPFCEPGEDPDSSFPGSRKGPPVRLVPARPAK